MPSQKSGIFTEVSSESEIDFGKRYLGFPDEECTFKSPKRIKANTWKIITVCDASETKGTEKSTATLEKRGKIWHLTRGEFVLDFSK
jgi:hypothetical protein